MDWEASSDMGQVQNICNNFLRHKKRSNDQALLLKMVQIQDEGLLEPIWVPPLIANLHKPLGVPEN